MLDALRNEQCHWFYQFPLCSQHQSKRLRSMFAPRENARSQSRFSVSGMSFTQESDSGTVNPFDRVVLSVDILWWMGVANPLILAWRDLRAVRLRAAWLRFRASCRDAIALSRELLENAKVRLGPFIQSDSFILTLLDDRCLTNQKLGFLILCILWERD